MSLVDRHETISRLFSEACELEGEARERFLEEACAGDPDLRAEVASLLDHDDDRTMTPVVSLAEPETALECGTDLGRHHIVKLLGRGGMGQVYEAEELESGRRVAIKTISPAAAKWTTTERFLREGRLAASINHPNAVYVYGTEEVDERLLIVMELMPGGTLADQVRAEGPLPTGRAVDAILQVIAGLQAAQAAGILHRDVKPSNCFLDADGRVKVGDFGISVSSRRTQPDEAHGTLGTPAYAPPEQLREEPVDVRSDIYSVGATLYYLLTGKPPFDQRDPSKQITAALESPPPAPRSLRSDIPRELERIALRCLAKDPARRFSSYQELADALHPHATATARPARLGLRLVAWIIDWGAVFWIVLMVAPTFSITMGSVHVEADAGLAMFTMVLLYFGLVEGLWGATAGKAMLGLTLARPDGAPVGLGRALLRALLLAVVVGIAFALPWEFSSFLGWLVLTVFFVTARRRNGLAAIHDLLSGTRVFETATSDPVAPTADTETVEEPMPTDQPGRQIGPYEVLRPLASDGGGELLSAWDPLLRRAVWVVIRSPGSPALDLARQRIHRPTRLRWLAGRRREAEAWDAFEAPDGQPLLTTGGGWPEVRTWLLDLSAELAAGETDGTLPSGLRLDHLWVTPDGRAKLLDVTAPGAPTNAPRSCGDPKDPSCVRQMLSRVARVGLENHSAATDPQEPGRPPAAPLPLPARAVLEDLATGAIKDAATFHQRLAELSGAPHEVTRRRRVSYLATLAVPALFSMSAMLLNTLPDLLTGQDASSADVGAALSLAGIALAFQSLAGVLLAPLFRGGLLLTAMGIAVVASDGSRISRSRALARALAGWWFVWAWGVGSQFLHPVGQLSLLGLVAIGALCAAWYGRSPQDWLVDTWLVPAGAGSKRRRTPWQPRERDSREAPQRWPVAATTCVAIGILAIVGALASAGLFETPKIERQTLTPSLPSASPHGGLVIVDVYQAKLFLEAAAAGEPLHVEAEYEARAYELTDARGDSDGNGWTYRVSMRAKRRGWVRVAASAFNTRPIPEIRVRLPRGTPLRLDGRILEGEADLELAHLTITEAQFEARSGAMLVGVAEPLPLPLERFEIQLRFGGLQVRSLGNASPRSFRFEQSFGGAAIDLAGAWANDADVELVCSRSGVVFRLPANARAQGFDESGTERDGQYSVELTSGTVDIDADLSGCSMASGPSKGAVRVAWP